MQRRALAILILGLVTGLRAFGAPPMPEGIQPEVWQPGPLILDLIERAGDIQSKADRIAYLEEVEEALQEHPDWIDLHRFYLIFTIRDSDAAEIHASYRDRAAADSTNADLQYLLGLLERGPGAEAYYRKALELDPNHYHAMCGLGLGTATSDAAQRDEGYQLLYKAIEMHPDHPFGYQAVAVALSRMEKDYEASNKVCKLWQKTVPWSTQPLQFQVNHLRQLKRPDEARILVEQFVEDHPKNRSALKLLVNTYEKDRNPVTAAETQVKLAEIDKENSNAAYKAASLMATIQENEKAFAWLIEAAKRGFDDRKQAETDPKLVGLRSEARFAEVLENIDQAHDNRIPEYRKATLEEMVDRPAPPFTVKTLDDRELSLEKLTGKVVILDFWSTWCGPCRRTLPLIRKLHAAMNERPVEIICMNVWERDTARAKVVPYWEENKYPMQVGLAGQEDATNYGVTGIPALYVIDPAGRIRWQHRGYTPFMDEEITWVIDHLLSESN